jgi:protein-disulfide isomerase
MRSAPILSIVVLALALGANAARAQTPTCDALAPEAKAVARAVLEQQHPYDCCDETIARCLETQPACELPRRLADQACRLAAAGKDQAAIGRSLERRALTMMKPGQTHEIDLSDVPPVGCTEGKVRLVAYLCLRCPFCSKMLPALHREATSGRLAGKVALHVKLFPIKGHPGSTEANLAASAAQSLGKFWEFLLHAYVHFDAFQVSVLPDWAAATGLDRAAFAAAVETPEVRERLVGSKKEGLRYKVEATPTLFLNGRRYLADLDIETIVELVEEELESLR